ncbi:MAG: MerR family transcriptional regulator [Elusimicrobiaceae bacterium]|nr:MerR family transcriptional regulator [Elusimicrobiaceae bacterium]
MGLEELEQQEYFSIGDVKRITGVPEYSVRYWEAEFGLIRPIRLESGHRRYTKEDVYTILKIKDLIYKHKLTLEGAKKQLSHYHLPAAGEPKRTRTDVKLLTEIKETLEDLLKEW